jgi:hypothetical protein
LGKKNAKITRNAILLAEKIEKDVGVFVFPHIRRVACRGWDVSGGTWSWAMQGLGGRGCR